MLQKSARQKKIDSINDRQLWETTGLSSSVSLGTHIILAKGASENTIKHEYGHCLQSKRYGIFYLFIVGIPSALGNIWDKIMHKNWTIEKRQKWYYSRWPENEADKLGGVNRN